MIEEKSQKIFAQLVKVMGEVGVVGKGRENQHQHYKFRGIDEVLNALQPALIKHGVVIIPEVLTLEALPPREKGTHVRLTVRHTFYADDGSSVAAVTVGEAADFSDKACNKAMSAAMKYACLETLCIPTEEPKDTENDHIETGAPRQSAKPPPRNTTKPAPSAPGRTDDFPPPDPKDGIEAVITNLLPQREGTTNGKKWTRYGFRTADGQTYGTFSESAFKIAELARESGQTVKITFTVKGDKRTVEQISIKDTL